ncbi:ABC transporter permease [Vibrio sp. SS-MA-C1-2]|uniref:ABC transporter permease n=1 Tax=Vibrio sp. SS-MA-C1-2 TaxID=2908646 RepID=UPI001F3E610D|nr:ABC transporter permease [Vibrio sp. SS-MA-C1-2]UJF18303.1 ABC transporter permease [Vibrio sp. SS-MA-C1-2]
MTTSINWLQFFSFYLVLLIPFGLLRWLQLKETIKEFVIAVIRMTVQLLLVGLYLEFVFKLDLLWLNLLWLLLMILVASFSAMSRAKLPWRVLLPKIYLGFFIALIPVVLLFLTVLSKPTPWYQAQYLIPIGGMLLGNAMGGVVIGLNSFFNQHNNHRIEILQWLTMGATPFEATRRHMVQAVKASVSPQIASIATLGLVSLPGMMTGQILGGSNPMTAIQYQIAIMVGIISCQTIAVILTLIGSNQYLLEQCQSSE